jgi:hypothetical protein
VATALREQNWSAMIQARNLDARPGKGWGEEQRKDGNRSFLEWACVSLFYRYANQQALPLPPLPAYLHNLLIRSFDEAIPYVPYKEVLGEQWPPRDLWPMIGLAQHYGVNTRLLDWTRSPRVAAYFAATSGLSNWKKTGDDSCRIAVWRCMSSSLDGTAMFSPPRVKGGFDTKCRVFVVDVPYAGNPNLAAQSGRFTLTFVDKDHPTLKVDSPLDEVVSCVRQSLADDKLAPILFGDQDKPLFTKVTLPASQSAGLLSLLQNAGVDASRIFPGFAGCADAIREACLIKSEIQ